MRCEFNSATGYPQWLLLRLIIRMVTLPPTLSVSSKRNTRICNRPKFEANRQS